MQGIQLIAKRFFGRMRSTFKNARGVILNLFLEFFACRDKILVLPGNNESEDGYYTKNYAGNSRCIMQSY